MFSTRSLILLVFIASFSIDTPAGQSMASVLASPARPAADAERDAIRKPGEVLGFLGIKPGMTVLEVFAGGGYYTQILDGVVAPDGHVIAHNNQAYMGFIGPEFEARFESSGLAHTEKLTMEANDINLEAGSLDAAVMILAYHDFFFGSEEWGWPRVDETAFLDNLCQAMKPGAILGVVDHVAAPGGDITDDAFRLHRVDPERVKADMTGSCFDLAASSDLLRNPADDHTTSATEGPFKGQTDRFLFRFVRRGTGN